MQGHGKKRQGSLILSEVHNHQLHSEQLMYQGKCYASKLRDLAETWHKEPRKTLLTETKCSIIIIIVIIIKIKIIMMRLNTLNLKKLILLSDFLKSFFCLMISNYLTHYLTFFFFYINLEFH